MKLFFERLTGDETSIVFNSESPDFRKFQEDWKELDSGILESIDAEADISKVEGKFLLKLNLKALLMTVCDRCLSEYKKKIEISQTFLYSEKKVVEGKLIFEEDESEERFFTRGKPVELLDILREEMLLELPLKILCSDDCKGVCEKCGANLNFNKCDCVKDEKFNPVKIIKKGKE